jgi:tetratricopeptide (TPR) repeat protein
VPPPVHAPTPARTPKAQTARADSIDALLIAARTALADGKLGDALALAREAAERGFETGPWRVVTADALRGLGRASDAAAAYERAAGELTGADAYEAGYSAAYLRFAELKDPAGALAALDATRPDADGSPLEERGLALRVEVLQALGRTDDLRPIARRYLARYPHGELRVEMQRLAR